MIIFAPSYKRSGGVLTHLILPDVVYVVHQFEVDEYIDKGFNVIAIPDSLKGNIARVRNWLKRYGEDKGGDFCIIDDDIKAFTYWSYQTQEKLMGDRLMEHIESMFDVAKQWGVTVFGVNPAIDKGSYREYTPFGTTSYVSGSFNGFINCPYYFDESMPLKEDYDFTLQVCNGDRAFLRFNQYGLSKDDHGNLGGCANYRTIEREKQQLALLQRKWGKKIVRQDTNSKQQYDINPIIKVPIRGV